MVVLCKGLGEGWNATHLAWLQSSLRNAVHVLVTSKELVHYVLSQNMILVLKRFSPS